MQNSSEPQRPQPDADATQIERNHGKAERVVRELAESLRSTIMSNEDVDKPTDPWVNRDFEQSVRDTAYFLWEHDGRPDGMEQEYWFLALERCLRQREADRLLQQRPTS